MTPCAPCSADVLPPSVRCRLALFASMAAADLAAKRPFNESKVRTAVASRRRFEKEAG